MQERRQSHLRLLQLFSGPFLQDGLAQRFPWLAPAGELAGLKH